MSNMDYQQKERIYNFAKRLLIEACPQSKETPTIDALLAFQAHCKEHGPMADSSAVPELGEDTLYYEPDARMVEGLFKLVGLE